MRLRVEKCGSGEALGGLIWDLETSLRRFALYELCRLCAMSAMFMMVLHKADYDELGKGEKR